MDVYESINRTIRYSQKYKSKLNKDQLYERLIGDNFYSKKEIDKIIESKKIRLIKTEKPNNILKEKNEKAKQLANKIAKKFPDVLFLGITGSVAAEYPKTNDDIDLMIITKIDRLWITRLKLRFFILINKIPHRKFNKKENKDEFCFNLWLDEKSLMIEKKKQTIKNAIDLILVKPLIDKEKIYKRFLLSNDWAKKFVATGYYKLTGKYLTTEYKKEIKENFIKKTINFLVFKLQFWYMKRKIKKEKVGLHQAFFHH